MVGLAAGIRDSLTEHVNRTASAAVIDPPSGESTVTNKDEPAADGYEVILFFVRGRRLSGV
jgi:hypothetical protein